MGISGRTRVIGVWGHPVAHSLSPAMHNAALRELGLDWVYAPFDVDPQNVKEAVAAVRALGLVGVNVTVPLKELVPPYLDEVSDAAKRIGSVNTICNRDGKLFGESTDGAGFMQSLQDAGQDTRNKRALILGAGGSARAVAFALAEAGTVCVLVNRTQARAEALAGDISRWFPGKALAVEADTDMGPFDLVVNTTSAGMHPREEEIPALPPGVFAGCPFVCDLIYAPPKTRLLMQAEAAGRGTASGLGMLVHQGAISLSLWTGLPLTDIPVEAMTRALRADT